VVQTPGIGPFSGNEAAEADTEEGRDETRDGSEDAAGDDGDDRRDGDARKDGAPAEWGRRSWLDEREE